MPSELKRGFVRIASNYMQLGGGIVFGLLVVPLILEGMGTEGLGLIGLLGSSIGITLVVEEIVRRSMSRELSEAYHHSDPRRFSQTYNAALLLAFAAAGITLVIFAILIAILPKIFFISPPPLVTAARWFLFIKALQSVTLIIFAPTFKMYKVTERFIAHNMIRLTINARGFIAAGSILYFMDLPIERAVVMFALITAGYSVAVNVFSSMLLMWRDRRLVPSPRSASREALSRVIRVSGWNILVTSASDLHRWMGAFLMNWVMAGLIGNALFDPAFRLASYLRRAVAGMTRGSDVVAARISTTSEPKALQGLVHATSRLHGLAAFPGLALLLVLAEPIIEVWIAGRILANPGIENPQQFLAQAVMLVRIIALGATLRAISDGWIVVFYGAGHISRYAPWVLAGGIFNPIMAVVLLFVLPDPLRFTAPAWAYVAALGIANMVIVPIVTLPSIGMTYTRVLLNLLRPLVITMAASPLLLLFRWLINDWTFLWLVIAMASFATLYFVLALMFVMNAEERHRVLNAILRRLGRRPAVAARKRRNVARSDPNPKTG